MTLTDIASIGSLISSLAVLVSLVFLAQQIQQARRAQLTAIRQQRTDRIHAMNLTLMEPGVGNAVIKAGLGEADLSTEEVTQLAFYCRSLFLNGEDTFIEHRQGLVDEGSFARLRRHLQMSLSFPGFRANWGRLKSFYDPDYVAFIDKLIAETPLFASRPTPEQFIADIAAERATASGAPKLY